MQQLCNI